MEGLSCQLSLGGSGVDVSPIIWVALLSFMNEILCVLPLTWSPAVVTFMPCQVGQARPAGAAQLEGLLKVDTNCMKIYPVLNAAACTAESLL
jgi:hypothetical protein